MLARLHLAQLFLEARSLIVTVETLKPAQDMIWRTASMPVLWTAVVGGIDQYVDMW